MHVPAHYRDTTPAPLVLQFHGAGPNATAAGYERSSPLPALSDTKGFLDVFPQGLRAPNGNLAWNAYGRCDGRRTDVRRRRRTVPAK